MKGHNAAANMEGGEETIEIECTRMKTWFTCLRISVSELKTRQDWITARKD